LAFSFPRSKPTERKETFKGAVAIFFTEDQAFKIEISHSQRALRTSEEKAQVKSCPVHEEGESGSGSTQESEALASPWRAEGWLVWSA